MARPQAKIVNYREIPSKLFGDEAPGVSMRVLIDDENDGAPYYVLRMLEIEPGGNTPDHSHPFEHENFVIEGKGSVMIEGAWTDISKGDVVFVPAGTRHQYKNIGDSKFIFLCGIPTESVKSI